jgi:hypothetical protein
MQQQGAEKIIVLESHRLNALASAATNGATGCVNLEKI